MFHDSVGKRIEETFVNTQCLIAVIMFEKVNNRG